MELANALLENTNITYLRLKLAKYTKCSAEAMAKCVRANKFLQRIRYHWVSIDDRVLLCCFLHAIQESTSLKELNIGFPIIGGSSNLALESLLAHTQTLRCLSPICAVGPLEDISVATARSGLQKKSTLRELKMEFPRGGAIVSPIFTSLRDHPLLRKLCLHGYVRDLTGLETVLLNDLYEIKELEIHRYDVGPRIIGLTRSVLQALA